MRFSIVMPTRNRANLLARSLKTALAQTGDDYEIVVSNNCCEDHTDRVVQELAHPRLRCVRTERVLPMHEHWDFALRQARGEYVTFLCDDDGLHPRALEITRRIIDRNRPDLLAWNFAIYTHPHWPDALRRNTLKAGLYTNQVRRVAAARALRSAFDLRFPSPFTLPLMLNSLCRRAALERIVAGAGTLFPPTSPDFSSMALMLSAVDEYLWLDAPLMLSGTAPEGIGATEPANGQAFRTYIDELGGAPAWARHVPLRQQTSLNNIADSLLRARQLAPALAGYDLNWPAYFAQCRCMLEQRDRHQGDTAADWQEFHAAVSDRGPDFETRIGAALRDLRTVPAPTEHPAIEPVFDALPAPLFVPPARGEQAGFRNLADCAALLEDWLPARSLDPQRFVDAVLDALAQRPQVRRVVLYGLGRFGGHVWHALEPWLTPRGVSLCYVDDQVSNPDDPRAGALPPRAEWEQGLIVVTPWEDDAIRRRLESLRGERGRHFITWRDVATGRADGFGRRSSPSTTVAHRRT
ncbi:MAG TPA: glycosyltransferase family A protein [Phycisphaerae bacterium]|nr:glycosyltransferase family A protein [Phycisphaerae bacterium]